MSHTPGPWNHQEECGVDGELCFYSIRDRDAQYIASTWSEPHEGNAHLIAAAPDLLEALKGAVASLERLHPVMDSNEPCEEFDAWTNARAAIAKAEGK